MRTFASMEEPRYPFHRRSANGLHLYRVEGPRLFLEIQRVGSGRILHRVEVRMWPDQIFLAELETCANGRYVEVEEQAWWEEFAKCSGA